MIQIGVEPDGRAHQASPDDWTPSVDCEWHLAYPNGDVVGKARRLSHDKFEATHVDENGDDKVVGVTLTFRHARALAWRNVDESRVSRNRERRHGSRWN